MPESVCTWAKSLFESKADRKWKKAGPPMKRPHRLERYNGLNVHPNDDNVSFPYVYMEFGSCPLKT